MQKTLAHNSPHVRPVRRTGGQLHRPRGMAHALPSLFNNLSSNVRAWPYGHSPASLTDGPVGLFGPCKVLAENREPTQSVMILAGLWARYTLGNCWRMARISSDGRTARKTQQSVVLIVAGKYCLKNRNGHQPAYIAANMRHAGNSRHSGQLYSLTIRTIKRIRP